METAAKPETLAREACAAHGDRPDALIEILHAVQDGLGQVPDDVVPTIAAALNLSRADVHGVLSFYHDFHRHPVGHHRLRLCRAEACQSMGCEALAAHARASLGLAADGTSDDGAVSLETVYCLGNCALAPAAMLDGRLLGRLDTHRLDGVIAQCREEAR